MRGARHVADGGSGKGSVVACQAAFTLRETADLLALMGRDRHWSENLADYAPAIRACLDRLRDQDVELRVIDIRPREEGERKIRILGSRGGYDCAAMGETASGIGPVSLKDGHAGAGDAIFVPVAGTRPPAGIARNAAWQRGGLLRYQRGDRRAGAPVRLDRDLALRGRVLARLAGKSAACRAAMFRQSLSDIGNPQARRHRAMSPRSRATSATSRCSNAPLRKVLSTRPRNV